MSNDENDDSYEKEEGGYVEEEGSFDEELCRQPRRFKSGRQEVYSAITGYEPDLPGSSADAMEYYDACKNVEEKINYVKEYGWEVYGIDLSDSSADLVRLLIDTAPSSGADWWWGFEALRKGRDAMMEFVKDKEPRTPDDDLYEELFTC